MALNLPYWTRRVSLFTTQQHKISQLLAGAAATRLRDLPRSGEVWLPFPGFATEADHSEGSKSGSFQEREGAKAILREILARKGALNSDELWNLSQEKGLKSKRFCKAMLKQLSVDGVVRSLPPERAKEMGFPDTTVARAIPVKGAKRKGASSASKWVYFLRDRAAAA
mmetsp:Transcript_22169/g.53050  ORF Transcript_22169/g.53050 Transcript_22169/m.53050 type:complete len:168 (+) Transcript_22169:87-590(+)